MLANDNPSSQPAEGPDLLTGALIVVAGGGAAAGASTAADVAPYLTLIGAILVALITWYATDRRQARAQRRATTA